MNQSGVSENPPVCSSWLFGIHGQMNSGPRHPHRLFLGVYIFDWYHMVTPKLSPNLSLQKKRNAGMMHGRRKTGEPPEGGSPGICGICILPFMLRRRGFGNLERLAVVGRLSNLEDLSQSQASVSPPVTI